MEMPNLSLALPELLLVLGAMALLMLGAFRKDDATRTVSLLSVALLGLVALMVWGLGGERATTFGGMFVIDGFARFAKVLILAASALAIAMSVGWLEREKLSRFEYPLLMLFATLGMMMMVSANDFIALYVGLELQSLSLYVLAAYQRDSVKATEAGLKYFVLGALASGMLLYGASLIYGFAGTTGFTQLSQVFHAAHGQPHAGVIIGVVFVLAGLAFKVGAVPFHMWTPDVYEGSPTPVTAFFSAAPKIAALALLTRVMLGPFGELFSQWQQIVILISIASMALGAFAAINQTNIKRLMAYSSIGNVGYALIGVAAGSEEGVRGLLIYLAIYLFMTVGTFAVILSMRQKGRLLEGIDDLAGLSRSQPMMALALAIFMFSLAGIPPLAGFFGKFYIFLAAVNGGLFTLAVLGVLTSVVSAYYYLRIVKVMYFDDPVETFDRPVSRALGLIMAGSAAVVVLLTIVPAPLVAGAQEAAKALFPTG
ncbi:MAG: NADH-quinone oxidoreductase subunit NuoN [Alphaproteobacteria bacterium]|nr:NADH-quinone oxidoreductase subunit NuoN [Alphaproteobacteria bacterium]